MPPRLPLAAAGSVNAPPQPAAGRDRFLDASLLALVIAVLGVFNLFYGEKILVADGLGYDGQFYAEGTRYFFQLLREGSFPPEMAGRIFPVGVVSATLALLDIIPTDQNIFWGYAILGVIAMILTALFWAGCADALGISRWGFWSGAVALFLNFRVMKGFAYAPVLTDSSAYCVGAAMFYCFLKNNLTGMIVCALAGAFTWPTFIYVAYFLLLFPRTVNDATAFVSFAPSRALSALYGTVLAGGIGYVVFTRVAVGDACGILPSILGLSLVGILAFQALAMGELFCRFPKRSPWPKGGGQAVVRIAVVVALYWINNRIQHHISLSGVTTEDLAGYYFRVILPWAARLPLVFLVSITMAYGPMIIIIGLLWRDVSRSAQQLGVGAMLALAYILFAVIAASPRPFTPFYFMVVVLGILAAERVNWNKCMIRFPQLALAFLFSGIWLWLNGEADPVTGTFSPGSMTIRIQSIFNGLTISPVDYVPVSFALIMVVLLLRMLSKIDRIHPASVKSMVDRYS